MIPEVTEVNSHAVWWCEQLHFAFEPGQHADILLPPAGAGPSTLSDWFMNEYSVAVCKVCLIYGA